MKDESGGEGTQDLYSGRLAHHSTTQPQLLCTERCRMSLQRGIV